MPDILERYGDIAILVILFLEDLGIPMPIPADVAALYAGYRLREHESPLWFIFWMMFVVNVGATMLYYIARRGGRPLIDRFGHYLHLDAEKLEKTNAWIRRRGMLGIMIGRMLPGVRIVTVIACGLFQIPPRVFLPAQFIGISSYLGVLLGIGYFVGPEAAERIRLPAISLRLVLITIVAVGLPLLLRQLNRKTAADDTRTIEAHLSSRERVLADLLAGFSGMIQLTSMWAIVNSLTNLTQRDELQHLVGTLERWASQGRLPRYVGYSLNYLVTLAICLIAAVVFFQILMPRLRIGPRRLGRQTIALWVFVLVLTAATIALNLASRIIMRPSNSSLWLSPSGLLVISTLVVSLLGYSYVAAQARRLAIDRFADDPEIAPSVAEAIVPPTPHEHSTEEEPVAVVED